MSQLNPKIEVLFVGKPTWFDKTTIKLSVSWRCPECGNYIEKTSTAIVWEDPDTNESYVQAEMDKEWECDDCLSPEAKRRKLIMRRFDIGRTKNE